MDQFFSMKEGSTTTSNNNAAQIFEAIESKGDTIIMKNLLENEDMKVE